jgi:hypothetical protein
MTDFDGAWAQKWAQSIPCSMCHIMPKQNGLSLWITPDPVVDANVIQRCIGTLKTRHIGLITILHRVGFRVVIDRVQICPVAIRAAEVPSCERKFLRLSIRLVLYVALCACQSAVVSRRMVP